VIPAYPRIHPSYAPQDDLVDCKAQCKRLHEQAASLQHKIKSLLASKKELASIERQLAIS
jgi:prefoldin subunit 5